MFQQMSLAERLASVAMIDDSPQKAVFALSSSDEDDGDDAENDADEEEYDGGDEVLIDDGATPAAICDADILASCDDDSWINPKQQKKLLAASLKGCKKTVVAFI